MDKCKIAGFIVAAAMNGGYAVAATNVVPKADMDNPTANIFEQESGRMLTHQYSSVAQYNVNMATTEKPVRGMRPCFADTVPAKCAAPRIK